MAAPPVIYPEAAEPGESVGGLHETLGLPGFLARDFFAPAGTLVVAPEAGTITKLSGHDPSIAPTDPHGAYGLSEYLTGQSGTTYFITHLGSEAVKLGQSVVQGQPLGEVANFAQYGTPNHVHIGTSGGPETATILMNAPKYTNEQVAERGAGSATFPGGLIGAVTPPAVGAAVGNAAGSVTGAVSGAIGDVVGIPGSILDVLKWPFEHNRILRGGEMLAGTILVIIGLVMLTKGLAIGAATSMVASRGGSGAAAAAVAE